MWLGEGIRWPVHKTQKKKKKKKKTLKNILIKDEFIFEKYNFKLYNAVSAPVAATRDALEERLQSVRETASFSYNRLMENMGYGRERLKDIVGKEAEEKEEEAKEQQQEEEVLAAAKEQLQDYDEQYDTVPKIKLVYDGRRAKEFRVTRNSNGPNTKIIMANITPHIEMRTKVIYSFKSEIHRGAGSSIYK